MKTQYGEVSFARDGQVALLTIDRPPNNHVSIDLIRDLADALDDVDADGELRATVLASAGKVFCGGADLTAPTGLLSGKDTTLELYTQAARLFAARKPIVVAVQGAAIGAGLGLAVVADFRIAAPEARFASNFVKLGFHPGFGLTHSLPRLIGQQRAALMSLTGRRVKADEALAWGLVDAVEPLETLQAAALALAAEIAENAPLAVQATRATLRAGLVEAIKTQTDIEHREQAALRKTADFAEGVRAVSERRTGNFTGK